MRNYCNDPLGDMLSRLKNASARRHKQNVRIPYSRLKHNVLEVLLREGYVESVHVQEDSKFKVLEVGLAFRYKNPVIGSLARVSKPSLRIYKQIKDLPLVCNGLGTYILSTPKGVLSDREARELNVGGEVLLRVFSGQGVKKGL